MNIPKVILISLKLFELYQVFPKDPLEILSLTSDTTITSWNHRAY